MYPRILITILLIIYCFAAYPIRLMGQDIQQWSDRLMNIYEDNNLSDSVKILGITEFTADYVGYYKLLDKPSLDKYFNLTLALADKLYTEDSKVYIYSSALFAADSPEIIEEYMDKCLYYIKISNNPEIRYHGWMSLGRKNLSNSSALGFFFNGLNEIKDKGRWLLESNVYKYIAFYYSIHGNAPEQQLKYAKLAIEPAIKSGDIRQQILAWKELGAAYYEAPGYIYLDNALEAYTKAHTLYVTNIQSEKKPDKVFDDLLYMEIVVTLGSLYQDKKDMLTAIKYMNEALKIAEQSYLIESQAFCHKQLGIIYQIINNYTEAERQYLIAESLLSTNTLNTLESNHIDYEVKLQLASLYKERKIYNRSASYYKSGFEQYRKMFDEEIMAENKSMSAYYEAIKKEEDIAGLTMIVNLKEKQKYYYFGIIFILIIALFIIHRLYSYRITTAKQKEQQLQDEANMLELAKTKAELRTKLKNEETEELQQKLTLGSDLIEHKNKVLDNLKTFFADNPDLEKYKNQLKDILIQQNRIENNVNEITSGLQDIPMDFYFHLQKYAENKLTPLDLKYCRLIYLKTPSKEIADLLFVDPRTVRVSKYRLKQKLKLGKEDDLNYFIENIISIKQSNI